MKTRRRPTRVLLDANIWRYIADADAAEDLRLHARRKNRQIQCAPSVLYEALRTGDPWLRRRVVDVITRPVWTRLMPEVFHEAQEFRNEIARVRPGWLLSRPRSDHFRRLLHDWTRIDGGFWDRARFDTDRESSRVREAEGDTVALARAQAADARSRAIDAGWKFETIRLGQIRGLYSASARRSEIQVEPWRVSGLTSTRAFLSGPSEFNAFVEWLGGTVDIKSVVEDRAGLLQFWLRDVARENMPRHWLRWAFETLQALKKVTDGTPCDSQLGTYLMECDWFVTADKAFKEIVEKCREDSPVRLAVVHLLPGGPGSVEALLKVLAGSKTT